MVVLSINEDHAGCPPNNFTEEQLRTLAKSYEDQAYNMTCTMDGVVVNGLSDVSTTPYRVQSVAFDYTCPAVHNNLHDLSGLTCYQNTSGTPYHIDLAVEDGVFLLLTPMSAGKHTIHVTGSYLAGFSYNATQILTVQPVALTASVSAQPGSLDLSWPQTPDNYTVEKSPGLDSPDWQPANLSISLLNGTYSATAPVGADTEFFRLRLLP